MAKEIKKPEQLFRDTLKDVYFAEDKIVEVLPKMHEAATSIQLKSAFEQHLAETKIHVQRLKQVFEIIGEGPEKKTCAAILGITDEGDEIMEEYEGSPALDAGLLAAAQAVEHYKMSRYGTLRTWALELGYTDAAGLRPESFADHYSQARQFYISQTLPELRHIQMALAFELSKVETPVIRECVVSHLMNIDETLSMPK